MDTDPVKRRNIGYDLANDSDVGPDSYPDAVDKMTGLNLLQSPSPLVINTRTDTTKEMFTTWNDFPERD